RRLKRRAVDGLSRKPTLVCVSIARDRLIRSSGCLLSHPGGYEHDFKRVSRTRGHLRRHLRQSARLEQHGMTLVAPDERRLRAAKPLLRALGRVPLTHVRHDRHAPPPHEFLGVREICIASPNEPLRTPASL